MTTRRTMLDFPRNEAGLVDEFIGTAFDVVKGVYDNMDELEVLHDIVVELPTLAATSVETAMVPARAELQQTIDSAEVAIGLSVDAAAESAAAAEAAATESKKVNQSFPFIFTAIQTQYNVATISGDPSTTTAGMTLWVEGAIEYAFTVNTSKLFTINDPTLYPDGCQMRLIVNAHYDNAASNLDQLTTSYIQQFGEFLDNSDYEQPVAYTTGLQITRSTQTVLYLGEMYRIAHEYLPFTTTTWVADQSKMQAVGDKVLRQDLIDPVTGGKQINIVRHALGSDDAGSQNLQFFISNQAVSIWEFSSLITNKPTPLNPDTWDWSPALNAALAINGKVVLPGRHTYRLQDIRLYDGCEIEIDKSATVAPVTGNSQIFYCNDDVPSARNFSVRGGRVMNPSFVYNVTVFNCPQARRNVKLGDMYINGGGRTYNWLGVYWSKLNWMSKMQDVEVEACGTGFKFRNAAAVMHAIECIALDCNVGFDLAHIAGDADILNRIKVSGGVCQNNTTGVLMQDTDGTILDGMHFENNTTDIDCNNDRGVLIFAPEMRGNNSGLTSTGIKMRSCVGGRIIAPILAGTRQLGFFDINNTNTGVVVDMELRLDAPLINSNLVDNTFNFDGAVFVYKYGQSRSLGSTVINAALPICTYQRTTPDGGETITATGAVEGREVRVVLRPSNTYTSGAVTVLGRSVDVSGGIAIRAKNKTLEFMYRAAAGGWVLTGETGWI